MREIETHVGRCRRCTVCDGLTHHWYVEADDWDNPSYTYVCKHCPVVGDECQTCDGGDDADADCPTCQGEGVIPCGVRDDEDEDDD